MLDGAFRTGVRIGAQTFKRGKIECKMYSFQHDMLLQHLSPFTHASFLEMTEHGPVQIALSLRTELWIKWGFNDCGEIP